MSAARRPYRDAGSKLTRMGLRISCMSRKFHQPQRSSANASDAINVEGVIRPGTAQMHAALASP